MAKTVDQFSTIEDFRTTFNELSNDVGDKSGLRTDQTGDLVDAINSVEDKVFFFQEYIYTATAGQTAFSGNDVYDNSLLFRQDRIQVFQIDVSESPDTTQHLIEGVHYTVGGLVGVNYSTLTLNTGAGVGDKICIYSFTGSYLGTGAGGAGLGGHWTETITNVIFNNNDDGVILNADGDDKTTALTSSSYPIEFAGGKVYSQDDMLFAAGKKITATGGFVGNVKATDNSVILNSQDGSTTATFLGNVTGNIVGATGTFTGLVEAGSLDVDDVSVNGKVITMLGDTGDTTTITAGTNGTLGITTVDTAGANANITLTADGTVELISAAAKTITLDSGGAINLEPAAGSAVVLDGTISVDAGVVTGATSITSTTFVGDLNGDVYNGGTKVLENSTGALTGTVSDISNHDIDGLDNVSGVENIVITHASGDASNTDGHVLTYNYDNVTPANSKWENQAADPLYTDTTARNAIIRTANQGGNYGIRFSSDEARLDYTVVSSAPSGVGSTAKGHLWFVI